MDGSVSSVKNGFRFDLRLHREEAKWKFLLTVKNHEPRAQLIKFRSGQLVDFVIEKDGQRVWAWSAGQMFVQMLREQRLSEGESLGPYMAEWDERDVAGQRVPSGHYQLRAYFFGVSRIDPVVETDLSW